ncbi:Ger(x)C family spore germination protein [Guptibacillus algicola]|uniref:Ger(x)C family spore germination protein n=1 Tax=Guptibacillus algicola TaxID=225844 RepID=UPI001CD7E5D9|nr:Ger(x)C family spore germination protein [Alkalihalobacillus algicola]MCA0988754.1 Ger(x)C family spore germination protein [Alkalihalobacillus algicola]
MSYKKIPMILLMCIVLTACVSTEIIDEVPVVFIAGYDKGSDDKIKGTISLQRFKPNQEVETRTFQAEARTSKGLRNQLSGVPKPITIGKMAVMLFGEEEAEHGVLRVLDSFLRDPASGRLTYVGVVEGSAGDLIKEEDEYLQGIGPFLQILIRQSIEYGNMPQNNLHFFDYKYYGKGMDPYMPLLKKNENEIVISGLALFKGEKMVGKLDLEEMFMFTLINRKHKAGLFEITLPDGNYATLYKVISDVSYKVSDGNKTPKVSIEVDINANIAQYTGDKLDKRIKNDIVDAFEKKIEQDSMKLIKKFQELQIDPLALGDRARSQTRKFDFSNWENHYPTLNISVKANADIMESGVID